MTDRRVVLVTGPPCAGKSTHVAQRAGPEDLVLDADRLGQAEMQRRLDEVAAMTEGVAWVIRCAPGHSARASLAAHLRADDVLVLQPDNDVLFARARRRARPGAAVQAIRRWLEDEAGRQRSTTGRGKDPAPRQSTKW